MNKWHWSAIITAGVCFGSAAFLFRQGVLLSREVLTK